MAKSIIRIGSALLAATSALAAPVNTDGDCQEIRETVKFDTASTLLSFPFFTITSPSASSDFNTLSSPNTNIAISTKSLVSNPNLVGSFSASGDFEFTLHSMTLAATQSQVAAAPHGMRSVQAKIDCLGNDWNDVRGSKYYWLNTELRQVSFDTEEADKKAFAKCKIIRTTMYSSDGNWSLFALGEVDVSKVCA